MLCFRVFRNNVMPLYDNKQVSKLRVYFFHLSVNHLFGNIQTCMGLILFGSFKMSNDLLRMVKVVIHVEMPKAAPKSPFVIFKNWI